MCARVLVSAIVVLCLAVCVVVVVNKRPCNSDFVFPPLFSEKKSSRMKRAQLSKKFFKGSHPPFLSTLYDVVSIYGKRGEAGRQLERERERGKRIGFFRIHETTQKWTFFSRGIKGFFIPLSAAQGKGGEDFFRREEKGWTKW